MIIASASALMAILSTNNKNYGNVRFTDSRYMNDRSEHLFFVKRLMEYMEHHRMDYPYCQKIINELLLKNHTAEDYTSLRVSEIEETEIGNFLYTNSRHFLFCLSKENDSLHMWNYYIHNGNYQGYNIGIRLYEFLKCFDYKTNESNESNDPVSFYCGDVIYKKSKQEKEINALCESIEDFGTKYGNTPYADQFAMAHLWIYIECYGLFFKDESFADEKEYRIVLQFEESLAGSSISSYFKENNRGIDYNFFERNGILVPCLTVPLAKDAVKILTMAPIMESHIASASLQDFLGCNGYNDVEVKQSSIPIRF